MFLIVLALGALQIVEPIDFPALDAAIEKCERDKILPVFAAEAHRRSAAMTGFYQEQSAIAAERIATADKRRALREGAAAQAAPATPTPASTAASDQELSLKQLALDDRQRALDEHRRLETLRQEAVDLKRQYFLTRCAGGRRPG